MPEEQTTSGAEIKDLPQAVKDRILAAVKQSAGDHLSELVEKQFKDRDRLISDQQASIAKARAADGMLKELGKGVSPIGTLGAALLLAKGNAEKALDLSKGRVDEVVLDALKVAPPDPEIEKTLNLQDSTAGGIFVQGDVFEFFFDVLRPKVAVLKLGPVEVPMPNRSAQLTGFTSDATSTWVGEVNSQEVQSEPGSGARNFSAKKQMTIVPVSNSMLDTRLGPRFQRFVEQNTVMRTAIGQDAALIRGAGTQFTPKGLRYWAGTTTAMTATPTLATSFTDLRNALNSLDNADVHGGRRAWIAAPRSFNWLKFGALNTDNEPYWLEELSRGTFAGFPFADSNNVPRNLGGGGNESELYFADMDHVWYATVGQLRIEYAAQGTYTLNGSLVSAFERDEQLLRVVMECDLNAREEAVHVTTGLTWGA